MGGFLGISLDPTSGLANECQEILSILSSGNPPPQAWVVFYDGAVIAVYPDVESAYARLEHIIFGLDNGQLPVVQTLDEANIEMDPAFNGLGLAPSDGESSPKSRRKIKPS